jgi:hypothetical protein
LVTHVAFRLVIVWDSALLVLPLNPGVVDDPLYSAVMLYEPAASDGEHVAVLPVSATFKHRVVAPSLNVTVPWLLGFVPLADVTVAVNVSASPYALGFTPVVSETAVEVVLRAKKLLPVELPPAGRTIPLIGLVAPVLAYPVGGV